MAITVSKMFVSTLCRSLNLCQVIVPASANFVQMKSEMLMPLRVLMLLTKPVSPLPPFQLGAYLQFNPCHPDRLTCTFLSPRTTPSSLPYLKHTNTCSFVYHYRLQFWCVCTRTIFLRIQERYPLKLCFLSFAQGRRYYCEYCETSFPDNRANRRTHLNGARHIQLRLDHLGPHRGVPEFVILLLISLRAC